MVELIHPAWHISLGHAPLRGGRVGRSKFRKSSSATRCATPTRARATGLFLSLAASPPLAAGPRALRAWRGPPGLRVVEPQDLKGGGGGGDVLGAGGMRQPHARAPWRLRAPVAGRVRSERCRVGRSSIRSSHPFAVMGGPATARAGYMRRTLSSGSVELEGRVWPTSPQYAGETTSLQVLPTMLGSGPSTTKSALSSRVGYDRASRRPLRCGSCMTMRPPHRAQQQKSRDGLVRGSCICPTCPAIEGTAITFYALVLTQRPPPKRRGHSACARGCRLPPIAAHCHINTHSLMRIPGDPCFPGASRSCE